MLLIKKYNLMYSSVVINAKSGAEFSFAVDALKELMVRKYVADDKMWLIPTYDLPTLIKKCQDNGIRIKAPKPKKIKKQFSLITAWRKSQIKIKRALNVDNKKLIKKCKQEMNVLKHKLYDFQSIGSYFFFNSKSILICDVVGLGKTVMALAASEKRMKDGESNFNIIVCPSTLKKNWQYEIEKFTDSSFVISDGSKSKRKRIYKQSYKYDYLIINYEKLNNDIDLIKEHILDKDGYVVNMIVDEIQYINNRKALRSKALKEIARKCEFTLGLSATVIENKVTDLFSVYHAIDDSVFGDESQYFSFLHRYVVTDFFGNIKGWKNAKMMRKRMSPYFIRRFKEDVLDELPERIENNYWIDMSPLQRKFYDDMKSKILEEISDMEKRNKIQMATILPMIMYLRQCVLSTKLVGHKEDISTKGDELLRFIQSLNKSAKVVVFCHFTEMIEILHRRFNKLHIPNIGMHGKSGLSLHVPMSDRIKMVTDFDNSKELKILFASDILREGVNIIKTGYLVNFDLLFNPAKMEQRAGRIDRMNQENPVINIINLITNDSIENNIFEKLHHKKKMSKEILDDSRSETRLTIKNIKNILDVN